MSFLSALIKGSHQLHPLLKMILIEVEEGLGPLFSIMHIFLPGFLFRHRIEDMLKLLKIANVFVIHALAVSMAPLNPSNQFQVGAGYLKGFCNAQCMVGSFMWAGGFDQDNELLKSRINIDK